VISNIPEQSSKPIFAAVFGKQWDNMPEVFKSRYGNFAFKQQTIKVTGEMNIHVSRFFSFLSPFLRLAGTPVPYQGEKIPVTVEFTSNADSAIVNMNRTFYYPGQKNYTFNSRILVTSKGDVIDLMRFGIGVRIYYSYADNKVELTHGGYIWRIFGFNIPIPLTIILGKVSGHEAAVSSNSFSMLVKFSHPLLGKIFEYNGVFELSTMSKAG